MRFDGKTGLGVGTKWRLTMGSPEVQSENRWNDFYFQKKERWTTNMTLRFGLSRFGLFKLKYPRLIIT